MNKSIIKTLIIILFFIKSNYVYSIVSILVSGNPGTMTISTATAGEQPDSVQEGTTTYGIQVIGDKAGIFGSINSNMPTETSLYVQLEAPNKAISTGSRQLSTVATTLVEGIQQGIYGPLEIGYEFNANVGAEVTAITGFERTVTLTITQGD